MASFVYNEGAEELAKNTFIWTTGPIKAALLAESQMTTYNRDDTDLTAAIYTTSNRIGTDQPLTAGANLTIVKNTTDNRIEFDYAAVVTWTAVTGAQVGGILIYYDAATDIPICLIDITPVTPNGGNLTWTPASNVVFYLDQGAG